MSGLSGSRGGFSLKGLDGLLGQLEELNVQMAVKVLRQSLRVVFKPVLESAKANVPVWSGALRDSLVISTPSASGTDGDMVAVVGIKVGGGGARTKQARVAAAAFNEGQSQELPASRRWHFVELGTIHMAAHPFLRPALDSNAQEMIDGLKDIVAQKIQAALAKGKKR